MLASGINHLVLITRTLGALSIPMAGRSLYCAVRREDQTRYERDGFADRRLFGGWSYIGLRESVDDAFDRARLFDPRADKRSHVLLCVAFVRVCTGLTWTCIHLPANQGILEAHEEERRRL